MSMQSLEIISVNFWQTLISLCNLLIIFLIMKKFLFKPVQAMMKTRREQVDKIYSDADESRESANQMKQDLFVWNRDAMDEELVANDIEQYTDGEVQLDTDNFRFAPVGMPSVQQLSGNKRRKKK